MNTGNVIDGHKYFCQLAVKLLGEGWGAGKISDNLPLDMFTKDGNMKNSAHCYFTQLADLIAYAAFLKIKSENSALEEWQKLYSLENLYDSFPRAKVNMRAQKGSKDGIVRLK